MLTLEVRKQWEEFKAVPSPFKRKRNKNPFINLDGKLLYNGETLIQNNEFAFQNNPMERQVIYKNKFYSPEEFNMLHIQLKKEK